MENSIHHQRTLQYAAQHLPLLRAVFLAINPHQADEWTYVFASVGITDASFPAAKETMRATCCHFGIHLSPLELDHFDYVQYRFFGKIVENGQSISYPDDRPTPYEPVYTPGFPIAGTFSQVEKVVTYADPSKVFARKRLLHIEHQQKCRIETEIRLLQRFHHPHSVPFHGMYTHSKPSLPHLQFR